MMLTRRLISPVQSKLIGKMKTTRTASTTGTNEPTVLAEEVGPNGGLVTLNRPKALNAINLEMVRLIYGPLKAWEQKKSIVVVKGAGEKSFCAGGDIRTLTETGPTPESKSFFREEYTLNYLIGTYRIPYVALIDGITMGGGVGLSVHGKYRIATERTVFAMPETAIGLFPDVGGGYFLPRLTGRLGMYLGLTGFRLKGKDVLYSGVATHFCPSERLDGLEKDLLNSNGTTGEIEKILNTYCAKANPEEFILNPHLKQINDCFSAPNVEGIIKNLTNDGSEWSKKQLETLRKMSPTSMKITFKQLNLGAKLDLAACLEMDYRLAVRHLSGSDFTEGVNALLIKRDNNPQWNPAKLEDVTPERVDSFFRPFDSPEEELILKPKSQL